MNLRNRLGEEIGSTLLAEGDSVQCQACGVFGLVPFYEIKGVPTQTCVLLETRDDAVRYPLGDVLLAMCERCEFIQNIRFEQELVDYSQPTEEGQASSPRFSAFASALADELVERYDLKGRDVLEVGCGKGDFLYQLAERGIRHGHGIDPGYLPRESHSEVDTLEFQRAWFGPDRTDLSADLVISRHLMEHIPNVRLFLGWLRQTVKRRKGASLFTEVPDARRVLADNAFWDVYYEHCSYFTADSLARALRSAGFSQDWLEIGFDEQYLLVGSKPDDRDCSAILSEGQGEVADLAVRFARGASAAVGHWRDVVESVVDDGGRLAIWGGGSKAVAFMSSIGVHGLTVVDINPRKQGKWLPSVAAKVRSPDALRSIEPTVVIAMNSAYRDEIGMTLREMALRPDLVAL